MGLWDILDLVRVRQWYKNLLLFLPLFFSGNLFHEQYFWLTVIGFLSFCLASSFNYIVNDLKDLRSDQFHPEKRRRALASGKVGMKQAYLVAGLFLLAGFWLAMLLPAIFLLLWLVFIANSLIYTLFFKDIPTLELLLVSISFVIRAVSGGFVNAKGVIPYAQPSAWLVVCTFALAFFMVSTKRMSDALYLGKKSPLHKKVFGYYTKEILRSFSLVSGIILVAAYLLYSLDKENIFLIFSVPAGGFCVLRYYQLVKLDSPIARNAEFFYRDSRLLSGILCWLILIFLSIYLS
jgi:decaprenyl-phosphate phosphoribosyltransferase